LRELPIALEFRLGRHIVENVGLRCRKSLFEARIKLELGRAGIPASTDRECVVTPAGSEFIAGTRKAIAKIDRYIDQFLDQPLTPRMVEDVLGITKQERSRWSKDGRLKRSGTASFKRGQVVQFYTHSVEFISALARHPSIIAVWRAEDATAARTSEGAAETAQVLIPPSESGN
jgi:hypothetical protein